MRVGWCGGEGGGGVGGGDVCVWGGGGCLGCGGQSRSFVEIEFDAMILQGGEVPMKIRGGWVGGCVGWVVRGVGGFGK